MIRKLTADDGRMVDMLLNGESDGGANPPLSQVFSNPQPDIFEQRLDAVEKVLSLLDYMPASDPPANLISRTLDRIDEAGAHSQRVVPDVSRPAADDRPHA